MTAAAPAVDLILYNAEFHTQDPAQPRARALAAADGRIVAVGDNDAVRALATPRTTRIDLQNRLGLPGFIDTHFHFYEWALGRRNADLAGVKNFDDCLAAVSRLAQRRPKGRWVVGQGFNESDWPENRMPLRRDLDRIAPAHPVVIWRCDLHLAVANSAALKHAGIDRTTPDPPEGRIEKDIDGRPTGVLRELAINLVKKAMPPVTSAAAADAIAEAVPAAHALGLTGIHDVRLMGGAEGAAAMGAWQLCRERGRLPLRTWVTIPGESLDAAVALGLRSGCGDHRLRIGHVKFFADGGMGARTAWVIEPYRDAQYGMPLTPMPALENAVLKAHRHGLAVMIHAVGDRTVRELIKVFESLNRQTRKKTPPQPPPVMPHRIEHVQMIRPEDVPRLAGVGIMASVQPANLVLDINMIDECLGPNGVHTYAFQRLLDAGIDVCLSSDAPVCDPDPLVGIHAAVTRRRADGTPAGGWYADQRLSVPQAVMRYTRMPAIAGGALQNLGTISVGKRADVIVLDKNIFEINPSDILDSRVGMTVFNGKVVYRC